MEDDLKKARVLSRALEKSGYFEVLSEIHHPIEGGANSGDEGDCKNYVPGLPVVAFRWTDEFSKKHPHLKQSWLQTLLRVKAYIIPNYELSAPYGDRQVLRIVVRETTSEDAIELLFQEILSTTESLANEDSDEGQLATISSTARAKHPQESGQTDGAKGKQQQPKSFEKHHHSHGSHPKHAYSLKPGSGTRASGYARPC